MSATDEQREAALRLLQGQLVSPEPIIEPYLTLKAAARKLNLHPSTLWRWGVPKHDLGGRPRFLISEIQAYLQSDEFKRKATALQIHRRDRRKEQLLALAAEGNAEAAADLFKEFGIEAKPDEKGGAS
ncbi:MAG: helix-turn-helix domain-containing protein [Kiritimatiellae bacterium]|nr:helix-turn-helix domain-containing protein [Kiritimatiellia bacterium]